MRDILPFAGVSHAITFDGLGENYSRLPGVIDGVVVGRIYLARVMATTIETPDIIVRHIGDHGGSLRILAKEMLADVVAALGLEVLVFAVHTFFHHATQ